MRYGLKDNFIESIVDIFRKIDKVEKLIIYGSRVKGNYKVGSDIDLAIVGEISIELLNKIAIKLDDLDSPYTFDLCIYNKIKNNELKKQIDNTGELIYSKDSWKFTVDN